ncbi:MAG TPA: nucleotidyltransferase family protein [Acidimicrobiales bacterium]|nr:nucleotidyltransferase family protein [Acidimicrobiales bacterium]
MRCTPTFFAHPRPARPGDRLRPRGSCLVQSRRPTARWPARRAREHRNEVVALLGCYGLASPHLFGSVARGDERPNSDIDLLVDVPVGTSLLRLARCQAELEALLGAPVDLVPAADLKRGLVDEVPAEAVAL